ncbi:uncharacterized protein LOC118159440 isoform X2 [Oxyura jamaicensis]|uniref:uncharacterized protein LOC118159440 isoform X2 n=1 Tax=Oxyura jamaicensis TaxID=8884 RepID=UPI0015A64869|nr:uncharacterized protein LOC118159440 isoform X2 [Oxyura jamaicensis]
MQFLSLFLVVFADLEFLGPAEKDIKGRVEVLPNLLKHPKQQKESLHELLLQEETIKNIKRERDTNNERRERECSTSKKKSDKEKDRKEQSDQNTTTLKVKKSTKTMCTVYSWEWCDLMLLPLCPFKTRKCFTK